MAKPRIELITFIALCASCTFLATGGARSTFPSFDFIIPGDEAAQFLATGKFPEKSCVSSLGSYIPPGTSWLAIPGMAMHRPLFLQLPAAAVLFVLTLVGIYLLTSECAGRWAGFAAVGLFGFSANGMWWGQSFWPRAYPVCYVWITLFTVLWVKRRQSRYLGASSLIYLLGMSAHMELIFAAVPIVIIWLWRRPPIGRWAVPAAIACSLIVWLPYFRFESGRQFIDLRSQLLRHPLPEYNTAKTFPNMIERFDNATRTWTPLNSIAHSEFPIHRTAITAVRDILPSSYVNFKKSRPTATMLVAIAVAFFSSAGLLLQSSWKQWAQERALLISLVCISLAVPWLLLSASEPPGVGYRQWGLWSLECVVACIGASFLLSLPRGRWLAVFLILAWATADGKNSGHVLAAIARDGWAGSECGEARICDAIASQPRAHSVRVGYLTVFHGFEMALAPEDRSQKIGIELDRYLRWRYSIENQAFSIKGFGDDDEYRVLQTFPDTDASLRFIPHLGRFTRIMQADNFELWKRSAAN